ncbi:TPR domain protein [Aspergillus egyptiacus]|nr:TPR domain protein [Aspergillus egyptiacus]
MFHAATTRRTSGALLRNRTPPTTLLSRPITLSSQPRPRALQHITNPQTPSTYNQSHSQLRLLQHPSSPLQTRSLTYLQKTRLNWRRASRAAWRKSPISLSLTIAAVAASILAFVYVAYVEITHNIPQYSKFPPPVAERLRKAVYYTEVDLQPQHALKAYREALKIALATGMHPYSDEVLGIKLQVAMMLEKAGLFNPAADLLERTRMETVAWVENGRKEAARRKDEEEKTKLKAGSETPQEKVQIDDPEILAEIEQQKQLEEYEEKQRDKVIKKAVGMSIKLSELYASDHLQEPEKAQAAQEAAVELCMKELARRQSLGLPVGGGERDSNGGWLNRTEIAIALTGLGETYLATDKEGLAVPLFLRALDLIAAEEAGKPSCKQVMLLNHVSTAMAARAQLPIRAENPEAVRAQAVSAARQWAVKTLEVHDRITGSERDESCDAACVSAMYNLGGLAEQQGQTKEAKKWYGDALASAKKLGTLDPTVVEMLEGALRKMSK